MNPKKIWALATGAVVLSALFSTGHHHFDEHWQIVEFASFRIGRTPQWVLPWEYAAQMRPGLQPFLAYVAMVVQEALGSNNPFILSGFLRLLSGGLFLLSSSLLIRAVGPMIKHELARKWLLPVSLLTWFAVYHGCRFSAEAWSGGCFALGFALFLLDEKPSWRRLLIVGALMGACFEFKYQGGVLGLGFVLWLLIVRRIAFKQWLLLAAGLVPVLALSTLADYWLYGEWVFAPLNYIDQNLIQDKVSGFGLSPWWWYFTDVVIRALPPYSLLLLAAFPALLLLKPKNPVGWVAAPFILIHVAIGHKELRFLFPLIPLLPFATLTLLAHTDDKWKWFSKKWFGFLKKTSVALYAVLLLVVCLKPADNYIAMYRTLYKRYEQPITLYCLHDDPYYRAAQIHHYRRAELDIKVVESLEEIPLGEKVLLVYNNRHPQPEWPDELHVKSVYNTYPDWMMDYNFNNWQNRSRAWYVVEWTPTEGQP